ncbi:D-alanine--poly(phosphoribitol) ligase subunit 1 [Streptococcus pneumoniae]|nr:D-alanine--poly(phosphoribitol) ligase subunit 1 [Streptococcus pneumoniae]
MSNKPIADMIETIEHFAQTQPSYPVYNVLGQEHTYGDLKADSDSLAAVIDQLGLPEKSPVVVFGGQEYEMLATFVALTKSGHAYIPIDSHSALERVSAIFSLPIAIWTSTPSFADMAMLSEYFNSEKMPGITHFYFDGEELTVKTAQKLRERFPNARIINAYGPTEATVALSAVAVTDEMLATLKRLPIGYTKADSPTFIIDEEGNKLPNGEQGEIIVSGPAVSKGYMNNPEKTAEAFFEFEGLPAYHTGDVGTMTDEGLLLYGGRMDFQIKFNGYRIELEDVSQNLNKSRFIESAVAVPRYNKDHKVQNLLAYVILKDGVREQFERDIDITKAIKEDLTDIMMSYMMPSKFLYRDSLPLTPNGKIDIKGLINEVNKR